MQLEQSESGTEGVAVATSRDRVQRSLPTARQRKIYVHAVDRYYAKIYGFLFHMARDRSVAEDLTQETFASAWQNLHRFEERCAAHVWLHQIALNAFRAHIRTKKPDWLPIEDETLAAADHTPLEGLDEMQQRAQQAVSRLPELYREVIVLHYYQGLKYREIAELLELPLGTVQGRTHTAFQKLRSMLEGIDDAQ